MCKFQKILNWINQSSDNLDVDLASEKIKTLTTKDIIHFYENDLKTKLVEQVDLFNNLFSSKNDNENTTRTYKEMVNMLIVGKAILVEDVIKINSSDTIAQLNPNEKDNNALKDHNLLDSAINGVYDVSFYDEKGELYKSAVIWFRLIKNHAFTNANKRTAMVATKIGILKTYSRNFSVLLMNYIDMQNILYLEELKREIRKFYKGKLLYNKKVSLKTINKTIENLYNNFYETSRNKFIKTNEKKVLSLLLSNWKERFSEDYALSIFIAQSINSNSTQEEISEAYDVLERNLLNFMYFNAPSAWKIIDGWSEDYRKLFFSEREFGIFSNASIERELKKHHNS